MIPVPLEQREIPDLPDRQAIQDLLAQRVTRVHLDPLDLLELQVLLDPPGIPATQVRLDRREIQVPRGRPVTLGQLEQLGRLAPQVTPARYRTY